jgi:FKBP-type peptidyl-prolyl cis-trans isomerase 2
MTQQAKAGDTVSLHYKGTLTDGTIFDSSEGREPLSFALGANQVIEGFDAAVTGMAVGEKKTIHIPVEQAYGQANPEMVIKMPRSEIPADMVPEVGMAMHLSDDAGEIIPVMVVGLDEESITLDANHPLSGQDLNFDLELVSIG